MVVKLALIFREDKNLDEHEYALEDLQNKVQSLLLTVHSFDQVSNNYKNIQLSFLQLKHSYSQSYLLKLLNETQESLLILVKPILSERSSERVKFIFQHFNNAEMLDSFFRTDGPHAKERVEFMEVIADIQFW